MSSETEQLRDWNEMLQKENQAQRIKLMGAEGTISQLSAFSQDKPNNFAEVQISFDAYLNKVYHLLSGHEIEIQGNREVWVEPKDDRLKLFSDYGVKRLMNILQLYLDKATTLGYYADESTILWKVRDFGIELSDLFTNKYEDLIHYPTPEELFERYKIIVQENKMNISDEELYEKCLKWSEEELKSKEAELEIVGWALINAVHSAYSRAFLGKERTSLGEKGIRINQNNDGDLAPQFTPAKKGGLFSNL